MGEDEVAEEKIVLFTVWVLALMLWFPVASDDGLMFS